MDAGRVLASSQIDIAPSLVFDIDGRSGETSETLNRCRAKHICHVMGSHPVGIVSRLLEAYGFVDKCSSAHILCLPPEGRRACRFLRQRIVRVGLGRSR
jgi:hypothetical protein